MINSYPFRSDWIKILVFFDCVIIFSIVVLTEILFKISFLGKLQTVISFSTLIVAVVVWYNAKMEEREENLPKKLDVSFFYEGHLVYKCEKASLMAESDIRALGQQIGCQMTKVTKLDFAVTDIITNPKKEEYKSEKDRKRYYMRYFVEFHLTEKPEKVKEEVDDLIKNNSYKLWKAPFINKESGEINIKVEKIQQNQSSSELL